MAAVSLLGQRPQPPTRNSGMGGSILDQGDAATIRVTVRDGQVDAVVTDKSGTRVTGLKPGDFEITVGGKKSSIQSAIYFPPVAEVEPAVSSRAKPQGTVAALKADQVARSIAIVVDDLGISAMSIPRIKQSLRKFVAEQTGERDLLAVLRTSSEGGAWQKFTSDRRELLAAIDSLKWTPLSRAGVQTFAAVDAGHTNLQKSLTVTQGAGSGDGSLAVFNASSNPEELAAIADQEIENARIEHFAVGSLGGLTNVARAMRLMPGRRIIFFVSDSLPLRVFRYDKQRAGAATVADGAQLYQSDRIREAMRRLSQEAARSLTVIHAIEARGRQSGALDVRDEIAVNDQGFGASLESQRAEQLQGGQIGLATLAMQNAGRFLGNREDLDGAMTQILTRDPGYYLLSFRVGDSEFAKAGDAGLPVRLKLKRPDLRLASRTQFRLSETAAAELEAKMHPAAKALFSPFRQDAIPVRVSAYYEPDKQGTPMVAALVHVEAGQFSFETKDGVAEAVFEAWLATTDDEVVQDHTAKRYTLRVPAAELDKIRANGLVYTLFHKVKRPGAYVLRAAVVEVKTGRMGTSRQFVEIPKPNAKIARLAHLRIASQSGSPHSQVLRDFRAGQKVLLAGPVLNGAAGLQRQVTLYRQGEIVQRFPFSVVPDAAFFSEQLALQATIAPGPYEAGVVLKSATGAVSQESFVDFTISAAPGQPAN